MVWLNWSWIGIAVACVVAGFVGGCVHEKKEFDLYRASVEATAEAQKHEAEKINEFNNKKTKEVAGDYERRIAAIRTTYSGLHHYGSCPMPNKGAATGIAYAGPSYDVLAESCAETTQQLISLQTFVKETQ